MIYQCEWAAGRYGDFSRPCTAYFADVDGLFTGDIPPRGSCEYGPFFDVDDAFAALQGVASAEEAKRAAAEFVSEFMES